MSVTIWERGDAVEEALSALRDHDAAPELVERIRARCLADLAARRGRQGSRVGSVAGRWSWLEPALALGLGALYLADAVVRALAFPR